MVHSVRPVKTATSTRTRPASAALEAENTRLRVELSAARKLIASTHKRGVTHENCTTPYCPICVGGLFVCAECGAAEADTERQICPGPEARLAVHEVRP